ncbi:MAG: hypothetical protein Q7S20_02015 [Gemmatimonadaceae bacterium]|nr:hypothetical protein [Gemmatimonadaceae bacterium]
MIIFLFPESYIDYGRQCFGFGFLSFLTAMWFFRNNLLFQSRLLLLVTIGYYAGLIKAIDPSAAFSPVGIEAQTLEVGAKMFALTSLALLGAFGGLVIGFRLSRKPGSTWPATTALMSFSSSYFYFATVIVFITGYLSARSYGNTVFESGYASGSGKGQLLGNLQAIGVIAMVVAVTAGSRSSRRWVTPFLIFLGSYFFIWGIFLRGGRIDVLSGILAVVIGPAAANGRIARFRLRHYVVFVFVALAMEAWGTLRTTLSSAEAPEETIVEDYKGLMDLGIYNAGTISSIATTFSNTVDMMGTAVNFDHGKSYFDYVLRTPPEFIYPNRPRDLAWMFQDLGYSAIGGMFELAEAFFNFGLIGCLLVPFCISYAIGVTYRKALRGQLLWFFILASVLAETFRGGWYQTFAFYKGAVTGIVLYFAFVFVANSFGQRRVIARA